MVLLHYTWYNSCCIHLDPFQQFDVAPLERRPDCCGVFESGSNLRRIHLFKHLIFYALEANREVEQNIVCLPCDPSYIMFW